MASNVISRKTVREALATLIDGAFNADWDIFNYKTATFAGKARNIVVSSAGSRRDIKGADADNSDSGFRFRVFVFVLYQDTANSWTAQNSEDALDGAEKALADLFNDNIETANWSRLIVDGETDPDMIVDEGGQTYRREIITVKTEHYT